MVGARCVICHAVERVRLLAKPESILLLMLGKAVNAHAQTMQLSA